MDSTGNLYVADDNNFTIRKVTPVGTNWVVTTLAGSVPCGSADGTGSAARFSLPHGVAVDGAGNLYVADAVNYTVRKVTPTGEVTTLAGLAGAFGSADGTGIAARFERPDGVDVDTNGNLYVTDYDANTIRKVTSAGEVTTLAGSAGNAGTNDGTGTNALFNGPWGLAVGSAGNVYVADSRNDTIRKVTAMGVVTTLAGSAGDLGSADGTGTNALFSSPRGLAVDSVGNLYVADNNNVGPQGDADGSGDDASGSAGNFNYADGTGTNALFNGPDAVAVDSAGNAYVVDFGTCIRKVTPAGVVTTLAGLGRTNGSINGVADGTGSAAHFNPPLGVAVDRSLNVYLADTMERWYPPNKRSATCPPPRPKAH